MSIRTKEEKAAKRRRREFTARFAVLFAVFALFKFILPMAETMRFTPPKGDTALTIFTAETGMGKIKPLPLSQIAFALPLPEVQKVIPETGPSKDKPEAQPEKKEEKPVTGGLFYVPENWEETKTAPENDAVETTITGENSGLYFTDEGIYFKNNTEYDINVGDYLKKKLKFSADGGAVLIIHTHGSESYAMDEGNVYEESDPSRTTDKNYNVVRVGDVLADVLEERGVKVIHDREMYDYPNYNGSYTRSYEAIQKHLREHPDIKVVIDLHRDALVADDGTVYKTVAEVEGETCSQVMLILGSDWSGLHHPKWQENLAFGFKLQKEMADKYPTLARPLKISQYRYNQQATTGSLIAEIGCNGNTLPEAIRAVTYFGDCIATVLGK